MVLESTSSKVVRDGAVTQELDILLETIVQVQTNQSRQALHVEAINVLSHLVKAFCSRAQGEASDLAFTVELASQLCLQTAAKKRKLTDEVNGNEVETLASQVA